METVETKWNIGKKSPSVQSIGMEMETISGNDLSEKNPNISSEYFEGVKYVE